MRIKVSGKNIEVTSALRNVVEKKISRLDKFFNPDVEVHATLSVQRNRQTIEVTIPFNGVILRGEEASEDMYTSIDTVVDILEGQIRKQKTKLQKRTRGDSLKFHLIPETEDREKDEPQIVRTKRFAFKPMSTEEAVLQMDLLGHDFFVYMNAESDEVNVVYKRKDGNYGLIEPDFE